jgi:DNA-binding beta-propeller fold protein YncE
MLFEISFSRTLALLGGFAACAIGLLAQTTTSSATFGDVISLGETPSDIVLDESRGYLYLVNTSANTVDIYDYVNQVVAGSIPVGSRPVSAAMSMDNQYLYVTNNSSSTLSVIQLSNKGLLQTVSLPANPDGVEVGADGRALIATEGSGTSNLNNTLLIFDRTQPAQFQITPVQFPPPPTTPTGLPSVTAKPTTTFKGKLQRTPNGNFIVGVSVVNSSTQTVAYVYEVDSGTLLASRYVTGQSTTLSMAPDGSRFMAGYTLYDTSTLAVLAQETASNAPFPLAAINTTTNVGGSFFSPDGTAIYGAFNVAPVVTPAASPQASTLLVSDSHNLAIQLGIKLPQSIIAKMVVTADGTQAWGLSNSGLVHLPLSNLYNYPILQPSSTTAFLAEDNCHRGLATATVPVSNIGQGTLTFSVPDTGEALEARATSGAAPSSVVFTMDPGRTTVVRQPGTNLYTGGTTFVAGDPGIALPVNVASSNAINIPNTINIFMNYRQTDQRGIVFPIPQVPPTLTTAATGTTATVASCSTGGCAAATHEGLQDIVYDPARNFVYITNSGYNRVEVFNIAIPVGQLPHQMALGLDGNTLYVGNTGGETISVVDLNAQAVANTIEFPPIPRAGATAPAHVLTMAMGLSGLQFLMGTTNSPSTVTSSTTGETIANAASSATASQWEIIGGTPVLRQADTVAVNPSSTTSNLLPTPVQMVATAGGENIITMNGTGTAYLYNGLTDSYDSNEQVFSAAGFGGAAATGLSTLEGYYGPLAAGPAGAYFITNGAVLSSTITQELIAPGSRNVAAVAPVDQNSFVRITTPQKTTLTATATTDPRPLLELWNLQTGGETNVGAIAENPATALYGAVTSIVRVPPRQMVVDSNGNVYAITVSGLTVIPLTLSSSSTTPQITGGAKGIVNSSDGSATVKPGGFITITGTNLALSAAATSLPTPNVLGGSCVVFNNVAIPLLQTSPTQISGQIPATVNAGTNVVQVRSLATGQSSTPVVLTVQHP